MPNRSRWLRWASVLAAVFLVLAAAVPALAKSRSFSSGGSRSSFSSGSRSSFSSGSRSFSSPSSSGVRSSSPSSPSRPSNTSPSTSTTSRPSSTSSYSSPTRSFSSPSTSYSTSQSTSRGTSYSSGTNSYSAPGTRSFTSPATGTGKTTFAPNSTGTTTINNQTYPYRTDSAGRPIILYDLPPTSVYRTYPPVVVYGAPPLDPWYYHDYYWGRPWYWRIWHRPVYHYYGPGSYGYSYSWLTWLAAIGGTGLAVYLFYLYFRRRSEL